MQLRGKLPDRHWARVILSILFAMLGTMTIELDEFLARLGRFIAERVPAFRLSVEAPRAPGTRA